MTTEPGELRKPGPASPGDAGPDANAIELGTADRFPSPLGAIAIVLALTAFLMGIDFLLPRNINVAIFYVVPILLCARARSISFLWAMVAVCIALTYLGIAVGPTPRPGTGASAFPNRFFVSTVLLIMGTIIHQRITSNRRFEIVQNLLAERNVKLRESEARFRATFEQAAIGITHADLKGRFLRVNDRVCQLTGYSREELSGLSFRDITHPDDLGPQLKLHGALVGDEIPSFQSEKRYLRKDGAIVWINLTVSLIRQRNGEPDYLVAIIEDISVRKDVEAALHGIRDELERRVETEVEERLQTEASLRQAQKMEALGQLTGGIAHDFNNILTTVIGNLERIGDSIAQQDLRKRLVDAALRSADHGAQLTKQLLSFARRQRLEPAVLRMDLMLTEFVTFGRRAIGGEIDLVLQCEDGLWRSRLDAAQLQTALLNLVINARDAMPDGGKIAISAHNETVRAAQVPDLAAGEYVRISVTDSGTGMAPDVLAQAFEPFYTTKDTGKGSGLGLSMVYGFARQSGGTAQIESALGVGTTVNLFLPRTLASAERETEGSPKAPRPSLPATILVVDDDEDVRSMSADALRDFGYRVFEAGSGVEALDIIEREPIDLLFSDVVMPGGMSGLDLARQARQVRTGMSVLLTTGYADALAQMPDDSGLQVLPKPFRPSELGTRVHRILADERL